MSYQEKNILVSLFSTVLIFGYYLRNLWQMIDEGNFNPVNVFTLWILVIIVAIIANIVATVITQVVLTVFQYIKTNEEEPFIEDERDKLIDLQGIRNAYYVLSVGILIAMISLIVGQPALVMFNLLIIGAMLSSIIGDISRFYLYRRGF